MIILLYLPGGVLDSLTNDLDGQNSTSHAAVRCTEGLFVCEATRPRQASIPTLHSEIPGVADSLPAGEHRCVQRRSATLGMRTCHIQHLEQTFRGPTSSVKPGKRPPHCPYRDWRQSTVHFSFYQGMDATMTPDCPEHRHCYRHSIWHLLTFSKVT